MHFETFSAVVGAFVLKELGEWLLKRVLLRQYGGNGNGDETKAQLGQYRLMDAMEERMHDETDKILEEIRRSQEQVDSQLGRMVDILTGIRDNGIELKSRLDVLINLQIKNSQ